MIETGVHLSMLVGPTVAVPAPSELMEALESVEVTHNDTGRSGFQMTFTVGRGGPLAALDYPLLLKPLLRPFNRVILTAIVGAMPRVLMDGVITNQQTTAGGPGASTLSVTGEDVSLMMDMEEKPAEHPAQDETIIAAKLIASYPQYGLVPLVLPPMLIDPPIPLQRVPVQTGVTDLGYLNEMAGRHGYVFYIIPGPVPFVNTGYWGPPIRVGVPQKALSVDMGPETNVETVNFSYDALAAVTVAGKVQDSLTNQGVPVRAPIPLRIPLSSQPAAIFNQPNVRKVQPGDVEGLNAAQAYARAQAQADASTDRVVTATGELDVARYGDLLRPRGLVGLRGAGYTNDGFYYVKSVTHSIRRGEYKQSFTLTREGVGALSPVVPV